MRLHRNVIRAGLLVLLIVVAIFGAAAVLGKLGWPGWVVAAGALAAYAVLAWPMWRMLDRAGRRDRQAITDRAIAETTSPAVQEALRRWFQP